jgi:hypothetical protein
MSTMTNSRFQTFLAAAVIAVASLAPPSSAQTTTQLRADIPFAFQFGPRHYPAGVYTVKSLLERFVFLKSKSDEGAGMVASSGYNKELTRGKLVFHRYGNHYFLEEIWTPNTSSHLRLVQTPAERHIRKELTVASRKAAPQKMQEVALR